MMMNDEAQMHVTNDHHYLPVHPLSNTAGAPTESF